MSYNIEIAELTQEPNTYLFRTEYINGEGNEHACSLRLFVDVEQKKANILHGRTEQADTCDNRLPLWKALKVLIKEALEYADTLLENDK